MAEHGDIKAHEATYNAVMSLLKWGTVVCLLLGAAVVWMIAS